MDISGHHWSQKGPKIFFSKQEFLPHFLNSWPNLNFHGMPIARSRIGAWGSMKLILSLLFIVLEIIIYCMYVFIIYKIYCIKIYWSTSIYKKCPITMSVPWEKKLGGPNEKAPKFLFGETFSKNVLIKDFWKILTSL